MRRSDARATLYQEIRQGEFAASGQLPPERDLAKRFGLARNTVRRVLDELSEEGLLDRQVGRGTFVRPEALRRDDLPSKLRGASPADLMEVRLIMEPQVAALAATRATAEDLAEMRDALARSCGAADMKAFEVWDARLHLAIFRAAKNALLLDYCEAINQVRGEADWVALKTRSLTPARKAAYDREHSAIVAAIAERNPEAARHRLFQHLSGIRDTLVSLSEF